MSYYVFQLWNASPQNQKRSNRGNANRTKRSIRQVAERTLREKKRMAGSIEASEGSEQLTTVLREQKWRVVDALVEEETLDATPILRDDEILCCEEYATLIYELHHVHLPELAANDIIEFDRSADEITRGERFDVALRSLYE